MEEDLNLFLSYGKDGSTDQRSRTRLQLCPHTRKNPPKNLDTDFEDVRDGANDILADAEAQML